MAKETFDTDRKRLLLHPGDDPNNVAAVYIDENHVVLVDPESKHSVSVNRKSGIGLQGPLSIQASPDQIRFSALWKINPLVLTCIPSTVYTPIPWLRQSNPETPKEMVNGIVAMAKLLAAIR